MEKVNQEIKQKAEKVLQAIDRTYYKENFSKYACFSFVCPTPESYITTHNLKEEDYSNLLEVIENLKNDPTQHINISDFVDAYLSFRGEEWVFVIDGEKSEMSVEEGASHILPMLFSGVHKTGKLELKEIPYCEKCGKEKTATSFSPHICEDTF